ncbi:MAG: GNAT family N-acetyltransferase [Rickettsiales bacterium]|jgi:ribosomal protein S18 acetylase RimI-like enzyme|nr:GNAT family N-acetyltransferase [Rickettsiales bacterium]
MDINIKPIGEHSDNLDTLANAYMESFRAISMTYKDPVEMMRYTRPYFLDRIKKFSKEKMVFVLSTDNEPIGFARFNGIPDHYKTNGTHCAMDTKELNGFEYQFMRRIQFSKNAPNLTDKTAIMNQIYLKPEFQNQGLGGKLVSAALNEIGVKYKTLIVEYNINNMQSQRFYSQKLGMRQIAQTIDFDHIVESEDGKAIPFYVSITPISYAQIPSILKRIEGRSR